MAGDWIKIRLDLSDDPDVLQISEKLSIECPTVVGHLVDFWCWIDRHTPDGQYLNLTDSMIDRRAGTPGFAAALREVHWLEGEDMALMIPNFDRHNGNTAKARALENEAKRLRRKGKKASNPTTQSPPSGSQNNVGQKRPGDVGQGSDKNDQKSPTREEKRREEERILLSGLIDYLNKKTGKQFKPVESNIKLLRARLAQGHSSDDIKKVIDRKVAEWMKDPSMVQYLRPATLFNDEKFNQYIGELDQPLPKKKGSSHLPEWAKLPPIDEKLEAHARAHGMPGPGRHDSYIDYRMKLKAHIEQRLHDEGLT